MTAPEYPGTELEAMSFAINYHEWIVEEIEPYLGRTVAEVGAGIGSVSKLLLQRGIEHLAAFEPSPNLFPRLTAELRNEHRAHPVNDFFGAQYGSNRFDSVLYINVLEHIEDDRGELARAFAALQPRGHVLVFVPALAWLYSDLDRRIGHYRRYSKSSLVRLATEAGFTVIRARYFDFAGVLPWYVNFVLLRNSLGGRGVAVYDRVVVPVMKVVERVLPPPVGKNVLLIGRKP